VLLLPQFELASRSNCLQMAKKTQWNSFFRLLTRRYYRLKVKQLSEAPSWNPSVGRAYG
jgi:hypothetical protein